MYDGSNIAQTTKSKSIETIRYIREPSIDRPLAQIRTLTDKNNRTKKQAIIYYHQDHLGTVSALTNQEGRVVQRYFYSSFGTVTRKEHPGANVDQPFTYTGRE